MGSKNARAHQVLGLIVSDWYKKSHRDLPWRKSVEPYHIFLSEIMLQQTRVETVIEYFQRFVLQFPSVSDLANASSEEVMNLWKGLGYYRRAQNLHKAAIKILDEHHGTFPDDWTDIYALPGVGDYTAGAIMSIAYNQPYPAVDGNVLRVVSRLYHIENDIMKVKTKKEIRNIVQQMIPRNRASDFCQGMMELGATICKPNPECSSCPLSEFCVAYMAGDEINLPIKQKKAKPINSTQHVFIVKNNEEKTLVVFRGKGLLEGLWGLPHYEAEDEFPDSERFRYLLKEFGIVQLHNSHVEMGEEVFISESLVKENAEFSGCKNLVDEYVDTKFYLNENSNFKNMENEKNNMEDFIDNDIIIANQLDFVEVGEISHVFTHRKWEMKIWQVEIDNLKLFDTNSIDYKWLTNEELTNTPIPEAFLKVLRKAGCV